MTSIKELNMNLLSEPIIEESKIELATIDFDGLQQIGLKIKPDEFDFVYGYPPLNRLNRNNDFNFIKTKEKLGIYLHIPFCSTICNFCYFVKKANTQDFLIETYISALIKEMALYVERLGNVEISYCYFGGGTPSLLNEKQIERVVFELVNRINFSKHSELTFEASPETLTLEKIKLLKELGITRISLGVQSFNDHITKRMNRSHNMFQSIVAIENISKYFPNTYNIDLIYGYPDSNEFTLLNDLSICHALEVPSITAYQLWRRVKTGISKTSSSLKKENLFLQKLLLKNYLTQNGYYRDKSDWFIKSPLSKYEFQNHKWKNGYFIGLGTSSYAYVNNMYYRNEPNIKSYIEKIHNNKIGLALSLALTKEDIIRRACALGIKINEGVDLNYLNKIDSSSSHKVYSTFKQLENLRLGNFNNNHYHLTEKGFLIPDNISELFFSYENTIVKNNFRRYN